MSWVAWLGRLEATWPEMRAGRTHQTAEHFTRVAESHKEGEFWGGAATAVSFSAAAAAAARTFPPWVVRSVFPDGLVAASWNRFWEVVWFVVIASILHTGMRVDKR